MTDTIHLAMCVDKGFALPLAVALASIERNCGDAPVRMHILHPGFDASLRRRVTAGIQKLRTDWIAVDDTAVQGAHYSVFLSRASLYRLLLGSLLPPEVNRVIYLDADTIVIDSLEPLFMHALDGSMIVGAIREANSPWAAGPLGPPWRELGLNPASAYFNSGVMLIDLDRWRAEDIGGRCLELLKEVEPRWGDQDALNTVLQGRWLELPRRWNVQSADLRGDATAWALWPDDVEAAIQAPAIIHYTERDKPWLPGSGHPAARQWFEHLDRTAWSSWRPVEPRPRAWESWARAVVRRLRERRAFHIPD